MLRHLFPLVVLLVFGAACVTPPAPRDAPHPPPLTILISIDGFRADYLDPETTPVMWKLGEEGVRGSLQPSFPSTTFPNHYSLVTGRRPDSHGLVSNRMEDPERPGLIFTLSNTAVSSDPYWWKDATPIWITAERQGVRTATLFWPGSDFDLGGRPSFWSPYDQSLPDFARVDRLLAWLGLPATERPAFAALYFDIVDTTGHYYGPNAPETAAAVAQVDAAIGRLQTGLDRQGLGGAVNLVIVSDHGMADVSENRIISLDSVAPADVARVIWDGPVAGLTPLAAQEAAVEQQLLGRSPHGECWRKESLPARFQFGSHRRTPAIVCLADLGWRYRSSQVSAPGRRPSLGAHGFDPATDEMSAIIIASGPAFKRGVRLSKIPNVSVYPLLAQLLGIDPEPHEGRPSDTTPALR